MTNIVTRMSQFHCRHSNLSCQTFRFGTSYIDKKIVSKLFIFGGTFSALGIIAKVLKLFLRFEEKQKFQ